MEQARLDAIVAKHIQWLRGEDGGERADLRYADLRSADLRSADLTSADLTSADLRSADLRSADLRSADLTSADLTYADLTSADLTYADLRSANLRSANLRSANLRSADLTSADLTYANLRSADLTSADLSGSNVSEVRARRLLSVGPVGSRNAMLVYDADADVAHAGYQHLPLADLLARVESVYPDGHQHRAGYLLAIEWIMRSLALEVTP